MSTKAGRELANRLVRHYLPWPTPEDVDFSELDEVCTVLMRNGTAWNHAEERFASDPASDEEPEKSRLERAQEARQKRMGEALRRLPAPAEPYRWALVFDGLWPKLQAFHGDDVREIPLANE